MTDRLFGDFGHHVRSPDLHLVDVRTVIVRGELPFEHTIDDPDRGVFVHALRGNFTLEWAHTAEPASSVPQGTSVGMESGRPHRWRATRAAQPEAATPTQVELFVSSIPKNASTLRNLKNGWIILPTFADPYATIIRHCVNLHIYEFESEEFGPDDPVTRRTAEICLIQFIRYVRSSMTTDRHTPTALAHDPYLLRAWTAYLAEPRRRWTIEALAGVAGLSRTSFYERFRRVFEAPPLQTLTSLRLEQAATMLRQTQAPLIEIAFTVGYNSEAAFVRAFHRAHGMPPGQFRHEHGATHRVAADAASKPQTPTLGGLRRLSVQPGSSQQ